LYAQRPPRRRILTVLKKPGSGYAHIKEITMKQVGTRPQGLFLTSILSSPPNVPKLIATVAVSVAAILGASSALATPILAPDLASFAVLGATGVTNVPVITTIGGNLGSAPNGSIGGGYIFSSGTFQANTATAQQAQLDLDAAILTLSAFGPGTVIDGGNLDAWQSLHGGVIKPGTYTLSAAPTNLAGNLILDGGGNSDAVWVFQLDSTLITSTTSTVSVQNVGSGDNVGLYWNVRSAATLNGATFAGNILAHDLISSDGHLNISCGRLLSATSQVTLIQDSVSITGCSGASGGFDQGVPIGSGGIGGSGGEVVRFVPEPSTIALLGLGLFGLIASRRKS
jgi:hypothetical protein